MIYSAFGTDYDAYPNSEGVVARALEQQLPLWHHVHSRHLINRERGIGRRKGGYGEGESDFVCIVPNWGFLVVECKSHSQVRIENGVWQFRGDRGWEPFARGKNAAPPIAQAWGNMHDIRESLKRVLGLEYVSHVRSGYAVCFPNLNVHLQFERDADHQKWGIDGDFLPFTIDRNRLSQIGETLKRLVAQLPPSVGCDTARLLPCLAPNLNFESPTQDRIFRIGQDLAVLTERQFLAVQGAIDNTRRLHLVSGAAGTGKTVVARRIAERLARRGAAVHLLCFSKNLALENEDALSGSGVVCETVHGCFSRLCRRANIGLPQVFNQAIYDEGLARHVLQLCRNHGVPVEQACIVDECQDLTDANLSAITALSPSKLVLLGDMQQSIFCRETEDRFSDFNLYTLSQNCRNPREIAGCVCAAAQISPDGVGVQRCPPTGRPPTLLVPDNLETRAVQRAESILEGWLTSDGFPSSRIAVLTARRPEETPLGRHLHLLPWLTFTDDYLAWKRDYNKVYLGTVHGFKGLDADAILLHHVPSPLADQVTFGLAHAYVGISRSSFDLVVQPQDQVAYDWYRGCIEAGARFASDAW